MALGAAILSVFMQRAELEEQRKEMREARKKYEAQATALDRANKLATRANVFAKEANELARSAQMLEVGRQMDQVDDQAVAVLRSRASEPLHSERLMELLRDPADLWYDVKTWMRTSRIPDFFDELLHGELIPLVYRRETLETILKDLRNDDE